MYFTFVPNNVFISKLCPDVQFGKVHLDVHSEKIQLGEH